MAQRFWVGGSGNSSDTAHWSTTSGGGSGASVPISTSDVFIDQNSGSPTCTFDDANSWLSLTIGNTANVTNQSVKTITVQWSAARPTKTVLGNISIYGEVAFAGNPGINGLIMDVATATFKMYTDSKLPYLKFNGEGGTQTISDGVADGGLPIYNVGAMDTSSLSSTSIFKFPAQTNGAFMTIDTWSVSTQSGFKPNRFDYSNNAKFVINSSVTQKNNQTSSFTNIGNSTMIINGDATKIITIGVININILQINSSTKATITTPTVSYYIFGDGCTFSSSATISGIWTVGVNVTLIGTQFTSYLHLALPTYTIFAPVNGPITMVGATLKFVKVTNGSITVIGGNDAGFNTGVNFVTSNASSTKYYRYDIYQSAGLTSDTTNYPAAYVGQWFDVISDPEFSMQVNSSASQMMIKRAVDPTNFDETTSLQSDPVGTVDYMNKVVVTCVNDNNPINGEVIFTGFISSYTPYSQGGDEYVEITLLPYGAELSQYLAVSNDALNISNLAIHIFDDITGGVTIPSTATAFAQCFTVGGSPITLSAITPRGLSWKYTNIMSFSIQGDLGDKPDGNNIWGSIIQVKASASASEFIQWLPATAILSAGTKYWFVAQILSDAFGSTTPGTISPTLTGSTAASASQHGAYLIGATKVSDTFTDTANTNLTSHTGETGATWTKNTLGAANQPKISNANRLKGVSTGTENWYYASGIPTSADYSVECTVYAQDNSQDDVGIIGRMSTTTLDGYYLRLSFQFGNGVELFKCVAGVFTQLGATFVSNLAPGNSAQLKLDMSGSTITAFLNGTNVISVTDTTFASAGRAGVRFCHADTDTTGFHLDNFTVVDGWVKSSSWGLEELSLWSGTGNTSIAYSAKNIKDAIADIMSGYATQGGHVLYHTSSWFDAYGNARNATIADPGINVTYTFNSSSVDSAIQVLVQFCPAGWYWYVDPAESLLYVQPAPTAPTHLFTLGMNIKSIRLQKTMETVVNNVYITGGDTGGGVNLWRRYVNSSSNYLYGTRAITYNDNNLVNTTAADYVGQKIIGQLKSPTYRAPVVVLSAPGRGYHIEVIKPGDMFSVVNYKNTAQSLIVSRVDYLPYQATIDASTVPPQINTTIQDIQQGLSAVQTISNPAAPTIIEV